MTFTESNTVEALVRDVLCGGVTHHTTVGPALARRQGALSGLGWHYLAPPHLPRQAHEVLVEDHVREALLRLNPDVAAQPDRADDVLYRLRAILMGVRTDGLVKANEEFAAWVAGERSLPFDADGVHVSVRLVDFEDVERNQYVVTTQYNVRSSANERRADLVLLVNGLPLVVIEAKTPVRSSQSWFDAATQVHDDYERNVPELFVPNLCSIATEGKDLRYGSIGLPVDLWGPWRTDEGADTPALERIERTVSSMLRPHTVLDLLGSYTAYATGKGRRRAKIVARYQQVEAANRIVDRVVPATRRRASSGTSQGSGKSLLMLFAARKLRLHPALGNPTVIIVVDRVDLDAQISSTFHAAGAPNLEKAGTCDELEQMLAQDARKIIITTIFRFGEAEGVLNDRHNIVVLADEAHRSQEVNLGRRMRRALPNAFLFGLTGTPINRADRNTFHAFGAEEDEYGYLSRYGFEESIRDGATKPLHFEPRLPELHVDREAIDAEYQELTGGLSDLDRERLSKDRGPHGRAAEDAGAGRADLRRRRPALPGEGGAQRLRRAGGHLRPGGLRALQAGSRPGAAGRDVRRRHGREGRRGGVRHWRRNRDAEERLLDRFRDPHDPLKILIVTSKLLTGFDAPLLQAMYLDKPLRDHTLLQAICRTNRPYGEAKTHGLIPHVPDTPGRRLAGGDR